jgi:two-component system NtrC family sensor kinase
LTQPATSNDPSASDAPATTGQEAGRAGDPEQAGPDQTALLRTVPAAPLDVSIPWFHRLSTKLLGVVAGLTVAAVVAFFIAETRMQSAVTEQMAHGAVLFSEAIVGATRRAMMDDHREAAYDTMRSIGRQAGVERVRILNKEGKITFSTDPYEVGELVDKRAEACYACHAADQPLTRLSTPSRARTFKAGDHRTMGLVTPIYNDRNCSTAGCHAHPASQQVLGVLDVGLSLKQVDGQIATFRRTSLVITAFGVFLLAGFFWFFARSQVVRPVAQLLHGTRAVAGERLEFEIPVRSKGELGLLAASFNDMTRSLRRAELELRALTHDLERQVDDRTADLRRAQAQLVQSEKLSSLGRLSASIAHEINNPLAGILTFAKLIVRTIESGPLDEAARRTLVKNLMLVQRETERCSAIVRNLLDFARERPLALKAVSLVAVVEEGLSLIAHQVQILGVTIDKRLEEVPAVHADFGQLRQAFVNVALNGCEAMGKGGKLTITTRRAGEEVELAISDTGPGISKENLSRIFDPFFTTKEKGTGLGLSVVYGIIQRHGGHIEAQSELGCGTTFVIHLPVPRDVTLAQPGPSPEKA